MRATPPALAPPGHSLISNMAHPSLTSDQPYSSILSPRSAAAPGTLGTALACRLLGCLLAGLLTLQPAASSCLNHFHTGWQASAQLPGLRPTASCDAHLVACHNVCPACAFSAVHQCAISRCGPLAAPGSGAAADAADAGATALGSGAPAAAAATSLGAALRAGRPSCSSPVGAGADAASGRVCGAAPRDCVGCCASGCSVAAPAAAQMSSAAASRTQALHLPMAAERCEPAMPAMPNFSPFGLAQRSCFVPITEPPAVWYVPTVLAGHAGRGATSCLLGGPPPAAPASNISCRARHTRATRVDGSKSPVCPFNTGWLITACAHLPSGAFTIACWARTLDWLNSMRSCGLPAQSTGAAELLFAYAAIPRGFPGDVCSWCPRR